MEKNCEECYRETMQNCRDCRFHIHYYNDIIEGYQRSIQEISQLMGELEHMRQQLEQMLQIVNRTSSELKLTCLSDRRILEMVVAQTGLPFDKKQEMAIATILDRIASHAIEMNDLEQLYFLQKVLLDNNYEDDAATPIYQRITRHIEMLETMHVSKHEDLTPDEIKMVELLKPVFLGNGEYALQFLREIKGMKNKDITNRVNDLHSHVNPTACKSTLYHILHDGPIQLYTGALKTWNKQITI